MAKLGVAMFATSLDLCSWRKDNIFDASAVVNSSSFNYEYVDLCDNGEYLLYNIHSVNTNTEVSKNGPNNTDKGYYVQTSASKIRLKQQNVSW